MADSKDNESDDGMSSVADFVQIYLISIDVVAAHNIEKADTFGKSDPFLKVSAFSTSYTTATILKTLDPVWNEHVEMTFFNDPKQLKFELFDYDGNTKDDPIGDCVLPLSDDLYSPTNSGFNGRLKLQNCKRGELEIKVFARKLLPLEVETKLTGLNERVETNQDSLQKLDSDIQDWNGRNTALQGDNTALTADIQGLESSIATKQSEVQAAEQKGEQLQKDEEAVQEELVPLEESCGELEKTAAEWAKKLEDIKMVEDKKYTENERLKEDIERVKTQLQEKQADKEREELRRREEQAKEEEEREKSERQSLKDDAKDEEDNSGQAPVAGKPTPSGSDMDDRKPLVGGNRKKAGADDSQDCCCVIQ